MDKRGSVGNSWPAASCSVSCFLRLKPEKSEKKLGFGRGGVQEKRASQKGPHSSKRIEDSRPWQTKPKKGPKRKEHMNFAPIFLCILVFSLGKQALLSRIELLFRNAPAKSS